MTTSKRLAILVPAAFSTRSFPSFCRPLIAVVAASLALGGTSHAQRDVFHRSESTTNLWHHNTALPWFYSGGGGNQNRPDNSFDGTSRHNVFIGHNNHTTMDVNGTSWYTLRSLTLQGGTTVNRTFNSSGGAGISLTDGLYINSGAGSHTFNNQFGVDAATVNFTNNGGTATLTNNIFLNNNTAAFGGASNFNVTGVLQGTGGSVTKSGVGTLTLSGQNTYTGTTAVTNGTLLANNATSSTGSGAVTVNGSGSTLGGTGRITGGVTLGNTVAGATINPGSVGTPGTAAAVGTLRVGSLTLQNSNVVRMDAFGTGTPQWDRLVVDSAVTLGTTSTFELTIASGLTFTAGQQYTLIENLGAGAISGAFSNIAQGGTYSFSGYVFTASYTGGDGNDFVLTAVPEPSTYAAGALALLALGFTQRRRLAALVTRGA
jgi:autotransporter-associated beta strand protein